MVLLASGRIRILILTWCRLQSPKLDKPEGHGSHVKDMALPSITAGHARDLQLLEPEAKSLLAFIATDCWFLVNGDLKLDTISPSRTPPGQQAVYRSQQARWRLHSKNGGLFMVTFY